MHEIFKSNPQLKKVYVTSDDTAFYQETDAKNHAKTLENKTVEPLFNELELTVVDEEELTPEQIEMAEFEAQEKIKADEAAQEQERLNKEKADLEADEKAKADAAAQEQERQNQAKLALEAFDPETTKYKEAVKLFGDLGLVSESKTKEVIYALLAEAKEAQSQK